MQKLKVIILSIVQMFFALNANACISINPAWYEEIIPITLSLLTIWLFIFAIYFGIRALVCRIIKNSKIQNIGLVPPLIYAIGAATLLFCVVERVKFDWCYIGYVGYIIFCCGYQLRAHIKQQKPKEWVWICPIVPFYVNIVQIILWNLLGRTYIIIRLVLFMAVTLGFSYGLYKLDLQKSAKFTTVRKIVWGLSLIICCVLSSYILYTYYAYGNTQNLNDCM